MPVDNYHDVLTFEVEHARTPADQPWRITISLANRDSTFSRSWGSPGSLITGEQLVDMAMWLAHELENAVILLTGVQGALA